MHDNDDHLFTWVKLFALAIIITVTLCSAGAAVALIKWWLSL